MQPELPFDLVTILLTDAQRRQLEPMVRRQCQDRRGLLLVSIAPHIQNDNNVFRLQAKFLPWRTANKILKLIRESDQTFSL
jgi:hypothetical protein